MRFHLLIGKISLLHQFIAEACCGRCYRPVKDSGRVSHSNMTDNVRIRRHKIMMSFIMLHIGCNILRFF